MLPRGQDFESAVAEFDQIFSRIPPQALPMPTPTFIGVQQNSARLSSQPTSCSRTVPRHQPADAYSIVSSLQH
jgi:hypothetical protein